MDFTVKTPVDPVRSLCAPKVTFNVDQASQAQPDQRRGDRYTGPLHCHRSALRLPDNNAVDRTIWLDNQTLRVIIEAKSPVTAALE